MRAQHPAQDRPERTLGLDRLADLALDARGFHTAVGGDILDGVLFETSVGPALGLERLPNWLFNELRTASSVRLLMADPGIPAILARIGGREGSSSTLFCMKATPTTSTGDRVGQDRAV